MRPRIGSGVGSILAGTALAALVGVALLIVQTRQGREEERERSEEELARAYAVQSRLLSERLGRQEVGALALAAEVSKVSSGASASPGSSDAPAVALPRWFQTEFDYAAVIDEEGSVIAGNERLPGDAGELASRFRSGSGLVAHDGALHLVAGIEVPGTDPRQVTLVGEQIDAPFAREVGDAISVELAYVLAEPSGPRVVASTLARGEGDELGRALRRLGDWSSQLQRASRSRLVLDGQSYSAMLSPLRSGEAVLGAVVTMAREDSLPPLTRKSRRSTLLFGLIGLALASAVGLAGARLESRPLAALRESLRSTAPRAALAATSPPVDGRPETVAGAVERRLRAERARSDLAQRASDAQAGRRTVGRGTRLVAGPAVVLALDLRRFAPTAAARHPDLALARYGADRDLVARAMAARGGELVAVAGHRLLGVFGRESVADALFAAVEIGALIQRADTVFDDPLPPAVALAVGDLVRGRIGEGTRAERAVLGRAVQETDALLREAMPGDIVFSASVLESLVEPLAEVGIAVAEQRAVLFPQTVHRVDLSSAIAALGPDPGPSAAPLVAGVVIDDRFELQAVIGEMTEGTLYGARDRETGALAEVLVLPAGAPTERLVALLERCRSLPPGVVPLIDGGLVDDRAYLASTAVAGSTLDALVEAGGPLEPSAGHELGVQLARALALVHRAGLTHPGLRPERVLVGLDGFVRLPWIGLDILAPTGASPATAFRAPEAREDPGSMEATADLYAWGAVCRYALLGEGWESLDLSSVPDLPEPLLRSIARCQEADPAARLASAEELVRKVEARGD